MNCMSDWLEGLKQLQHSTRHLKTNSYNENDLAVLLQAGLAGGKLHPHDHTKYRGRDRWSEKGGRKAKDYKAMTKFINVK